MLFRSTAFHVRLSTAKNSLISYFFDIFFCLNHFEYHSMFKISWAHFNFYVYNSYLIKLTSNKIVYTNSKILGFKKLISVVAANLDVF